MENLNKKPQRKMNKESVMNGEFKQETIEKDNDRDGVWVKN